MVRPAAAVAWCLAMAITPASAEDAATATAPATTSDTVGEQPSGTVQYAVFRRTHPWIHPAVAPPVGDKLEAAIDLAEQRVVSIPQCAALFDRLGADAIETLRSVVYLPAPPQQEAGPCRHALAHTTIGGTRTWVCRNITTVSDRQAAMVLIHEALHHAGLREKPRKARHRPRDADAMTSTEINEMVSVRCRL
jgi:hypothetical protein